MIAFPSILQYRHAINSVTTRARNIEKDGKPYYDKTLPLPILTFQGTVKLHGSNMGIIFESEDSAPVFQSRSRIIDQSDDHAGYVHHMIKYVNELHQMKDYIVENSKVDCGNLYPIAIFGEWCGKSIQKYVALTQLPKMFVLFAVSVGGRWIDMESIRNVEIPEARIYHIHRFGRWYLDIDFSNPESTQKELEKVTAMIEEECPAAKHFGVSGIGEGLAWRCISEGYDESQFWFKTKGILHMTASNEKCSKIPSAPTDPIIMASIHEFVDMFVHEGRLMQGLSYLEEQCLSHSKTSTKAFVQWVCNDVLKEESDTIVANGIQMKKLVPAIQAKASKWFMTTFET